jgi:hypothetical protein
MPDSTTPITSTEKTVIVNNNLCRLWFLTYISLGLNVLIIVGILVCAILHHHDKKEQGFGGGNRLGGDRFGGQGRMDRGQNFRHFGGPGQGWGRPGGGFNGGRFGGNGPGWNGFRGSNGGGNGPGNNRFGGGPSAQGFGRPGGFNGGPGMGMMGGGAPDPAKMTDNIVAMLSNKLALTDDQKAKLKPIIQDQVTQMQKDMEAQRQAMQKRIEDAKAKIKPILNADQQKQLDALPLPGQKPAPLDAAKPGQ